MDSMILKSLNVNGRLLDLSTPQVMGILNVTPDSFMQAAVAGLKPRSLRVHVRYWMKVHQLLISVLIRHVPMPSISHRKKRCKG